MNIWNWLTRRRRARAEREHPGASPAQSAYRLPPRLSAPDVHPRPLRVFLPMGPTPPTASYTQQQRMVVDIDDLRAERARKLSVMLQIDEAARAAWEQNEQYWGQDSGDCNDYDGGGDAA